MRKVLLPVALFAFAVSACSETPSVTETSTPSVESASLAKVSTSSVGNFRWTTSQSGRHLYVDFRLSGLGNSFRNTEIFVYQDGPIDAYVAVECHNRSGKTIKVPASLTATASSVARSVTDARGNASGRVTISATDLDNSVGSCPNGHNRVEVYSFDVGMVSLKWSLTPPSP